MRVYIQFETARGGKALSLENSAVIGREEARNRIELQVEKWDFIRSLMKYYRLCDSR